MGHREHERDLLVKLSGLPAPPPPSRRASSSPAAAEPAAPTAPHPSARGWQQLAPAAEVQHLSRRQAGTPSCAFGCRAGARPPARRAGWRGPRCAPPPTRFSTASAALTAPGWVSSRNARRSGALLMKDGEVMPTRRACTYSGAACPSPIGVARLPTGAGRDGTPAARPEIGCVPSSTSNRPPTYRPLRVSVRTVVHSGVPKEGLLLQAAAVRDDAARAEHRRDRLRVRQRPCDNDPARCRSTPAALRSRHQPGSASSSTGRSRPASAATMLSSGRGSSVFSARWMVDGMIPRQAVGWRGRGFFKPVAASPDLGAGTVVMASPDDAVPLHEPLDEVIKRDLCGGDSRSAAWSVSTRLCSSGIARLNERSPARGAPRAGAISPRRAPPRSSSSCPRHDYPVWALSIGNAVQR